MTAAVAIDDGAGGDAVRPWLVMVHGMSQDHRVFDRQVAAFRDSHRLLLIDLPGHGLADAVAGPYGHMEFAEHVRSVLQDHDVTGARYWGTHTGAAVGLLLAGTAPRGLIDALILEGPTIPGNNPAVVGETVEAVRRIAAEEGLAAAVEAWWRTGCWFDHMRGDPVRCRAEAHRAIVSGFSGRPWTEGGAPAPVPPVEPVIASIEVPALVYNGVGDHPEFLAVAARIASLMAECEVARLDDCGGFPAWEAPDTVNALVQAFLRRLDARR